MLVQCESGAGQIGKEGVPYRPPSDRGILNFLQKGTTVSSPGRTRSASRTLVESRWLGADARPPRETEIRRQIPLFLPNVRKFQLTDLAAGRFFQADRLQFRLESFCAYGGRTDSRRRARVVLEIRIRGSHPTDYFFARSLVSGLAD